MEILLFNISLASMMPLLVSTVSATVVSYLFTGMDTAFHCTLEPFVLKNIPFYLVLGVACGFLSLYFTHTTLKLEDHFAKMRSPMFKWLICSLGVGVLVFLLALAGPRGQNNGFTMHLLRAESPGPDVGKLVPKMRQTASVLYFLYLALTVLDIIFLLAGGMSVFDALCTAFGTAGTGGFGVKNDSLAGYSPYLQNVTTVFMLLFGVNFSCYYLLIMRHFLSVFRDEELRFYLGTVAVSTCIIAVNIRGLYDTLGETIRHAAFQVASIITTSGFATADFDLWPNLSRTILLCLMFLGACAGSTGGGLKCARAMLLAKSVRRNIRQSLYPEKVEVVRMNGNPISERVMANANVYLTAYALILLASWLIISLDGFSVTTNFSAVVSCFNNIGPGLEAVGPTCNYAGYSVLSKLVLIFDMLAGRLEILPMLALCSTSTWRRR